MSARGSWPKSWEIHCLLMSGILWLLASPVIQLEYLFSCFTLGPNNSHGPNIYNLWTAVQSHFEKRFFMFMVRSVVLTITTVKSVWICEFVCVSMLIGVGGVGGGGLHTACAQAVLTLCHSFWLWLVDLIWARLILANGVGTGWTQRSLFFFLTDYLLHYSLHHLSYYDTLYLSVERNG